MNRAILMGRLTKDPETRSTQNGHSVTNFTIAVDRKYKDANGERQTDFIPCVAWRQTADFIYRYFHKGERILVEGSIQPRSWDDDQGQRRYITEVVVDQAYFCESKNQNANPEPYSEPRPVLQPKPADVQTQLPFPMADEYPLPFDMGR